MSAAVLDVPVPSSAKVEDVAAVYQRERGKPMPGSEHAICQTKLIGQFLKSKDYLVLSELNLDLSGWRCVPDISLYPAKLEPTLRNRVWITEPPALAVEIFSPSQTLEEMTSKVSRLLAAGVASVWFVIPSVRVISVYQKGAPLLSATAGVLTDPVTGISVNVDEIFA